MSATLLGQAARWASPRSFPFFHVDSTSFKQVMVYNVEKLCQLSGAAVQAACRGDKNEREGRFAWRGDARLHETFSHWLFERMPRATKHVLSVHRRKIDAKETMATFLLEATNVINYVRSSGNNPGKHRMGTAFESLFERAPPEGKKRLVWAYISWVMLHIDLDFKPIRTEQDLLTGGEELLTWGWVDEWGRSAKECGYQGDDVMKILHVMAKRRSRRLIQFQSAIKQRLCLPKSSRPRARPATNPNVAQAAEDVPGDSSEYACVSRVNDSFVGMALSEREPANNYMRPRPYQLKAFELCKKENAIIHLPTGTKTMVASMTIFHYIKENPGKIVFFLVPTVALAGQQTLAIRNHDDCLRVADLSEEKMGFCCLKEKQVLVATGGMMKVVMDNGYVRMQDICLVVFDEAHHAIKRHPYVSIAESLNDDVRIIGLTASFMHGRMTNPECKTRRLERNLKARLWSPAEDEIPAAVKAEARFEEVAYEDSDNISKKSATQVTDLALDLFLRLVGDKRGLSGLTVKVRERAIHICELLGLCAWYCHVAHEFPSVAKSELLRKIGKVHSGHVKLKNEQKLDCLDDIDFREHLKQHLCHWLCPSHHIEEFEGQLARLRLPGKVEALLTRLEEFVGVDVQCIVFVEQRGTTYVLSQIINCRLGDQENLMPSAPVCGYMDRETRAQILDAFENGTFRILVVTNTLEEFIDSRCRAAISFDMFTNVKSNIQRTGRLRDAGCVVYFENDPSIEEDHRHRMLNALGDANEGDVMSQVCHPCRAIDDTTNAGAARSERASDVSAH